LASFCSKDTFASRTLAYEQSPTIRLADFIVEASILREATFLCSDLCLAGRTVNDEGPCGQLRLRP
jgi:hypothetical protein